ncbi:uncharacterized protein LOC129602568 isoform X2 [Paramacrobiotus metropolitanus]|uniref:uncharacterized protein LOC129602568 isoform X2 n=1 Tax=Paramacrobiotus metropolitanus TaxID=2943436 RepID=UPI002445FA8A|nr:uncharacterized protein LOC129602568 isoform X2 [Paramacrobiotus metropolitanus]
MLRLWILEAFVTINTLMLGVWSINPSTTYPSISCYKCVDTQNKDCDQTPYVLRSDPGSTTTADTFRSEGVLAWQYQGLVLPLKPYCYTYILQIDHGTYGMSAILVRGVAYPGGKPDVCVPQNEITKGGKGNTEIRYHYCDTPFCNTITKKDLGELCFKDTYRSFQLKSGNATSAAPAYTRVSAVLALLIFSGCGNALLSDTRMGILMLLAFFGIFVAQASALRCYKCQDTLYSPAAEAQTCYTSPGLLGPSAIVDCNDRYPPPNSMIMTVRQTGYCAIWMEQFTPSTGLQRLNLLGRGCVYPGGEDPDPGCLTINATMPTLKDRVITATYCRDGDLCNGATYVAFTGQCFGGSGTTMTTRDFNATGFTMPITTTTAFVPTLDPQIAQEIIARGSGNNTGVTPDAPGQTAKGIASQHPHCIALPLLMVSIMIGCH